MSFTNKMLPEFVKKKAAYLSDHFGDPECRRQLKDLIHEVIQKERKQQRQK